jgi:hypothetical protein
LDETWRGLYIAVRGLSRASLRSYCHPASAIWCVDSQAPFPSVWLTLANSHPLCKYTEKISIEQENP